MKQISVFVISTLAFSGLAQAQVGTTVKEGAKAVSEKVQQLGDEAKASVESQPRKTIDQAKAQVHKAKARHHRHKAAEAAKEAVK